MKYLSIFFYLLFCVSLGHAQSGKTENETFDYPDLKNPKIIEIKKIIEAEEVDYDRLIAQYDAIFEGSNIEDKVHLFVFDVSHPLGPVGDYVFKYSAQISPIFTAIDKLPESVFKTFAGAMIYKSAGSKVYKDPQEKTKYYNTAFHTLLNLASRGDDRSFIPLAQTASELYILGFKDEHLTEELILGVYSDYFSKLSKHQNLFSYLRKGLYYDNNFNVELSEAEKTAQERYKEISTKIFKNYLSDFPDADQYMLFQIWKSVFISSSFGTQTIQYNPEVGKSITQLVEGLKNDKTVNYKRLKSVDFLFRYLLDEKTTLNIQDYIALFASKKEAYDFLIDYLENISADISLEVLTQKPKWAATFRAEIEQDINKAFPYIVRYSGEYDLFLKNEKLEASTIQKSVDHFDFIKSLLFNKEIKGGYLLSRLYEYSRFMSKVLEQKHFQNNSDLKWLKAKMLLDFEYAHLLTKNIHSGGILGIGSAFNNWTPAEIEKYQPDVERKLVEYLEAFSKVSKLTTEREIVRGEMEKIAMKFNLL